MSALIAYAALALGISFVCSLLEATTLSLTDAYIRAMESAQPRVGSRLKRIKDNIDRPHIVLIIKHQLAEVDWFGMIPKAQGWNKSNLAKVMQRNNLPANTEKWIGKEIELKVNSQGFLRVAV